MTGKTDPVHHHKVSCYDDRLTCGRVAHQHVRTCWGVDRHGEPDLTCSRSEHQHTPSCTERFLICGNQ